MTNLALTPGNGAVTGLDPMRPVAYTAMPVRVPPKSSRIPMARGTLPAIAVSGLAGAVLIPLDRPGVGWLLAGLATAGAVYAVDATARRRADTQESATEDHDAARSGVSGPPGDAKSAAGQAAGATVAPDAETSFDAAGVSTEVSTQDSATSRDRTDDSPVTTATAVGADHGPAVTSNNAAASPTTAPGSGTPLQAATASAGLSSGDTAASSGPTEDSPTATVASSGPGQAAVSDTAAVSATTEVPGSQGIEHVEGTIPGKAGTPPARAAATGGVDETASHAARPAAASPGAPGPHAPLYPAASTNAIGAQHESPAEPETAWTRIFGAAGSRRSVTLGRIWWVALAIGLLGVGAVRAAEWLFVLCLIGAAVSASLAVVSRRSIYGAVYDLCAVPMQAVGSVPWVYRGMRAVRGRTASSSQRMWWSLLVTVALLLVFVPLLAGADAVFARFVEDLLPALAVDELVRWVFVFLVVAACAAGALYLLAGPPPAAADAPEGAFSTFFGIHRAPGHRPRRFTRMEWGLPIGALTLLFALFLVSRLAAMFGGDSYVMSNGGLTYAEYARSGFWQLSIVSLLTLAVIAVVQRTAAQESAADRLWLRLAVGAVSVLTLVIVASALHRMWVYQEAYGFTIMRLLVEVFELWIGLVYLMVLASLVKLRRQWVPRAAIGAAAATLLALAVVNPELLVAERNVDRALEHGKRLDDYYLADLSPDILPALAPLPAADRAKIERAVLADLEDDSWQGWNLSRSSARN
ncbi:DUF4153 domain-containing protein [Nocardia sp. NPDC055321]